MLEDSSLSVIQHGVGVDVDDETEDVIGVVDIDDDVRGTIKYERKQVDPVGTDEVPADEPFPEAIESINISNSISEHSRVSSNVRC
jgi:hypothetical protein